MQQKNLVAAIANAFANQPLPRFFAALLMASSSALLATETLPELAEPDKSRISIRPGASGLALDNHDTDSRFTVRTEASRLTGTSIGVQGAWLLTDRLVLGGGAQFGSYMNDFYANLGVHLSGSQRLILTGGQLRQKIEFDFPSGRARAEMTQNSGGAAWRFDLGSGLFEHAELSAYAARTESRKLDDKTWSIETAGLYELWNDPRRVAGSRLDGVQGRLGMRPWDGGRVEAGLGRERLRYDLQAGADIHNRTTNSLGLEQTLSPQTRLRIAADAGAAQTRTTLGLDHRFGGFGTLGVDLLNIRSRGGAPDDNRVQLRWVLPLGKTAGHSGMLATNRIEERPAPRPSLHATESATGGFSPTSLLDQVAIRPRWMPSQVIAKYDTTAAPNRLIVVDKTALPAGSSIDKATGLIATPLGVAIAGIASITRNGAAFANTGQFSLSGNNLLTDPGKFIQPAAGVTDVYVVTLNNVGGGTTNATVNVSKGSVRIDSIVIGDVADTTPNAFSFTDVTGQALSTVVESSAITIAGINAAAAISVTGGEYQINGGAWTSSAGTVTNGQTIKVRHTTSAANLTTTNTALTIGGVSDTFTTTTLADTTPNAFSFTDVTGQTLSTLVESNAITVAGINAAAAISVTGGEYQINGSAWTSSAGNVTNGQTVKVRHTTSASNSTATNTALTIGGVSDTFTTTTVAAVDTTPNAFSFTDVTNQTLSTLVESSAITVAGINAAAAISITGGEYQINGGAWTSAAGTVTNGQTVKVRHTTSASNSTATNTVLTIGGVSDTFTTTTTAEVPPVMGDVPNMTATSGSVFTSVNIGSYVTTTNGDAILGYTLTGTLPTGMSFNTSTGVLSGTPTQTGTFNLSVTATDNDGTSNSDAFTLTVNAAADTTPDAFSFTDVTGQSLSSVVESNAITVAGINAAAAISVTGGEYQINGGAWTSSAGTVTNGQTIKVRHTTSASNSTATNTALIIGGVSDTFTTTTLADTTPNAFSFTDVTGQTLSTLVESNAITVAGISAAAAISVNGGEYQINGGAWTGSAGTVTNGQTVKVRHTTSASNSTATNTALTIGGVSDTFTTTTVAAVDTTPNAFSFTDVTSQTLSTLVESNAITVAGINAAAAISVTGGEYQINGGAWTSSAGTVTVGQTVKVRHTTSAANSTATNTALTIGGVSDTFTTTTTNGYVQQGWLTWMPVTFGDTWANANTFCTTTTINGQTGWRLPTYIELFELAQSGAMNGQGWTGGYIWSSSPNGNSPDEHLMYDLNDNVGAANVDVNNNYVTCVR